MRRKGSNASSSEVPSVERKVPLLILLGGVVVLLVGGVVVGVTYSALRSTTSNPASSFSANAKFCSRSSAVWLTGMEHGLVSTVGGAIFNTVTGAPTADNATFRNGAYSLRIADAAAGSTINAEKTFTAASVVVARFAVRLSALPSVSSNLVYVNSGTDLVFGYDQPTQKFRLTAGASTALSASTVGAGTWYVIDLRYDLRNNPNLADWRIDGAAQTQLSRAAAATTATGFALGSTVNASIYTANYDDIFVANQATAYPVGDGKVVGLIPDGVGTHNTPGNFRNDDGSAINATSWQRLDEIPLGSGADWVRQQTNSATSYLEFTFGNTTETCIREISAVLAYHSATNTANNGKASVFDGATESIVLNGDMSNTAVQYAGVLAIPASAPWSQSAVDGLLARVGFSSDTNPNPYWDGIVLEVAAA
jgi:hypothetical protein